MNTTDLIPLPARPSVAQYREQSKDLPRAYRAGEGPVLGRVKEFHPWWTATGVPEFVLTDAQWVVALEQGFESWPRFVRNLATLGTAGSTASRFEQAADAVAGGDLATLQRLLREDPGLVRTRSGRVHGAMLLHKVGANSTYCWSRVL